MTLAHPAPIIVRLYAPLTLLFPKEGNMPLTATVPSPRCIVCDDPASPPSRLGWLRTPDRQAVFACCGTCSNCEESELEAKIVARVSGEQPAPVATAA